MKKSKFPEKQITFALRQAEAGTPVVEICRKMGVTQQSFYMQLGESQRLIGQPDP